MTDDGYSPSIGMLDEGPWDDAGMSALYVKPNRREPIAEESLAR